ncbi:MAG: PQQ-binding-like beta-propeller repeat protein, partial [Lentisphaeria bacterium]|nr:PQQ-binding-like beta-propeller repeat protein [Lentisphaeria bacterium]
LDPQSGEVLWTYIAGGRVDSSPLIVAGRVFFGTEAGALVALDLQSGAVRNWNPDLDGPVLAITSRNDGPSTIYLGGSFANANVAVDSQGRSAICAVDSSGSLTAWNPGSDNRVLALAYHNGKVYAGGAFTNIGGAGSDALVEALDADTDTDNADTTSFNPSISGSVDAGVYALRLSDDLTHIFVGGNFEGPTDNIAMIDLENGAGSDDWVLSTNDAVKAIEIVGSDVFFGGPFTQVTDPDPNYIEGLAKATSLGVLDTLYNPTVSYAPLSVFALAGSDAGLFVGGDFSSLGGKQNLALLDPSGNVVTSFNALQESGENVFALAFADNVLLTGGAMTGPIEGRVCVKEDSWDKLVSDGFGSADRIGVTAFAVYQGELFAAVQTSTTPELRQSPDGESWSPAAFTFNPVLGESRITDMLTFNGFFWLTTSTGEIYRLSSSTFTQINDGDSGFVEGSTKMTVMEIYNDFLYVGTGHPDGAQLWRTRHDRSDADYDAGGAQNWEKVADLNDDGQFPDAYNDWDLEITALYSDGTDLFFGTGNLVYGSSVYSSSTGDVSSWSRIGDSHNTADTAVTSMNSINGILFAGTRNDYGASLYWFDGLSWNITGGAWLGDIDNTEINHLTFGQNLLWATMVNSDGGAQVLRTTDGFYWTVSTKGGFGVVGTKGGSPDLIEFNEAIYWGGENTEVGAQIYRLQQPTIVEFSQAAFSFREGTTPAIASIQVERSGELNVKTTVEFNLADCGASIDKDYSGLGGTITWLPGDTAT